MHSNNTLSRCSWASKPLDIVYHDTEWGVAVYDDIKLFEFIVLESAQAGLNWYTILKKRSGYKLAYSEFNPELVAMYDDKRRNILLQDPNILRNKMKIEASISNAQAFLAVQKEYGSFSNYLWSFTGGKIIYGNYELITEIPASTALSDKISKDLKNRGFKFFGSTTCYAFLQAVGVANDHIKSCFRYYSGKS